MSNSPNWSNVSAPCRLEWRPSRWLIAVLLSLGPLSAISLLASALPRWLAWPVALMAMAYSLWLARYEARKPVRQLVLSDTGVEVDGEAVDGFSVHWRGALAFVSWRSADGRRQRLAWWPDVLPAAARRELRLAAAVKEPARPQASMAN